MMFKVSPLIPEFIGVSSSGAVLEGYRAFGFTPENASLLLSAIGIAGIILVFPAAALLRKLGTRVMLILIAVLLVVGGVLGALSTNFTMLLLTRRQVEDEKMDHCRRLCRRGPA
jgi:predicted MFS family arabinose efflux permease